MRRREVIALITGTAAECLATRVRTQPSKTFRLGILVNTRNAGVDELLKGLRDHGYVEGENLIIEISVFRRCGRTMAGTRERIGEAQG